MNLASAREGVGIALDALRANKTRAALTILGIVIGVATVMAMAGIVAGIQATVTEQIGAAGPNDFVVSRFDQTKIQFTANSGPPWGDNPRITLDEAEMLQELPSVRTVTPAAATSADVAYGNRSFSGVQTVGLGTEWPSYKLGDFTAGRNFLPSDATRSSPVAVLSDNLAGEMFEGADPIGRMIRLGGNAFSVVGVYKEKENLFSNLQKNWVYVPANTVFKRLGAGNEWVELWVVPESGVAQAQAMDDVTAALRSFRRLRPVDENNFALIRQEQFQELFNRLTGVFFVVMLVLSSVGLLVGGVGVVAIMMISVTERTREIGVRKALGATRREILWQFLVESMTVTVIGGAIGILLGGGGAMLLGAFSPIPASVPLWSVAAALAVSAISGIGFGLYPANKAARLDPVEALRHE